MGKFLGIVFILLGLFLWLFWSFFSETLIFGVANAYLGIGFIAIGMIMWAIAPRRQNLK